MLNSILKSILNLATKWFLQATQMLGPVWATPFVSSASTIGGMSWSHFFILHCKSCWNSFLSSLFNWSILIWSLHWQGHLHWYLWQIDRVSNQAGTSGRQKKSRISSDTYSMQGLSARLEQEETWWLSCWQSCQPCLMLSYPYSASQPHLETHTKTPCWAGQCVVQRLWVCRSRGATQEIAHWVIFTTMSQKSGSANPEVQGTSGSKDHSTAAEALST